MGQFAVELFQPLNILYFYEVILKNKFVLSVLIEAEIVTSVSCNLNVIVTIRKYTQYILHEIKIFHKY